MKFLGPVSSTGRHNCKTGRLSKVVIPAKAGTQKVGGIYHVVTGGGGAPLYEKPEDGGFYHYMKVTVGKGSAEVMAVGIGGDIKDGFTISGDDK